MGCPVSHLRAIPRLSRAVRLHRMTSLLADLPHTEVFPTVDEVLAFAGALADEYPNRVTVREVGLSRQGDPIQLLTLTVEQPKARVLVIGQPHPNEPIGMVTVMT